MSRRKAAPKRYILPDPLFGSELITKFINSVMRSGKKSTAEKIVYGALIRVQQRESNEEGGKEGGSGSSGEGKTSYKLTQQAKQAAIKAFEKALENVSPTVEVKSRRVGGSTYQVPVEVRPQRRMALAMRWLVDFAKSRNEKTMVLRLANEIYDAIHGRGGAVKKREDVHRMAKANQAFAHYRW
ncbi:MAG TPA: 30S ribosomal protein S7 [Gammaproteobacteria bacterium]|nr:30S ribosomal protein S7 [Gammaproteobacteria bacterium]